jgi:hypothetical protein
VPKEESSQGAKRRFSSLRMLDTPWERREGVGVMLDLPIRIKGFQQEAIELL